MTDLFDNPMGLMGFEFVEFASPTPGVLEPVFEKLGFTRVAVHRSKDVVLYRQGDINFIVDNEPHSAAAYFAAEHGPSACGLAFRVRDSHKAYRRALELGAQPVELPTGPMELRLPAIKGIGGAPLYLIDRFDEGPRTASPSPPEGAGSASGGRAPVPVSPQTASPSPPEGAGSASGGRAPTRDGMSIYDIDFEFLPGVDRHPRGHGFKLIDHMTHNVYRGRMNYWARFYERLFNFREIRYFDIHGEYTGLTSKAMTAPDGKIRIPLNEEAKQGGGQVEEFLLQFNGEGIQHIALLTDDLIDSVDRLQMAGIPLLAPPNDVYYEMLDERLPGHGEPVEQIKARGILLDGSTAGEARGPAGDPSGSGTAAAAAQAGGRKRLLLQIFSQPLFGPVFFEFIQRKGDEGFGEGNFKALFESMERDQIRRGALQRQE